MVALASLPKHRVYACARCGRRMPTDRMIYSRHTGDRYCRDLTACGKRAKKRNR